MNTKKHIVFPKHLRILGVMGENIKLARTRRKLTSIQVAERAGLDRGTLREIERGNPSVSLGGYFNVLRTLNLHNDILKIATDDEFGRKLQNIQLLSSTHKK